MTSHKRSLNGHSPVKRTGLSLKGIIDANLVPGHRRTNQDSVGSDQSAPLSPISESAVYKTGVSAAVSDESVAGDSGVFEATASKKDLGLDLGLAMNLETAQVQIKLRYSTSDSLLHIGIERARNLSVLFIPEGRKVCIKAALLPAIANVSYTFCTRALTNLTKPNFGENFPVAISTNKLVTKTLQVNVWAVDANGREDCLGSAQVSMADFNISMTCVKWYNVLSFHFMQPEVKRPVSSKPSSIHLKQESELSTIGSRQGTLKEESSDESTIISSQASTLTRNIEDTTFYPLEVEVEEEESEEEEDFQINESGLAYASVNESVDAETNTECVFIQAPLVGRKGDPLLKGKVGGLAATPSIVKRSKTFSPSAPINKSQYNCRLNRSDSDSAMPLYRRLPFQRHVRERRSLHVPTASSVKSASKGNETSLDLELDLAAQQSRLKVLEDEIRRLRVVKEELERVKERGDRELPVHLAEDTAFHQLLHSLEESTVVKSPEERRMEKLLKKTAKEIYKLRKTKTNKGQLDVQSFREKMAFFTCIKSSVPILGESETEEGPSNPSPLSFTTPTPSSLNPTPLPTEEEGLRPGFSTETVDTLTEDDLGKDRGNSQNSTPTPNRQIERFVYEVDPELGAFV